MVRNKGNEAQDIRLVM